PRRSSGGSPRREPNPASLRRFRSLREHKSLPLHSVPLRRSVAVLLFVAALASTVPAGAALVPIRRTFGDLTVPRVRTGTLSIPRNQSSGRVRVIVGLQLPPLAAWHGRSLSAEGGKRKLSVS